MASIWTGVRLQDVKAQLQLRGHQVPDQAQDAIAHEDTLEAEVQTLKLRQQLASVAVSGAPRRVLSPLNAQNLQQLDSLTEDIPAQKGLPKRRVASAAASEDRPASSLRLRMNAPKQEQRDCNGQRWTDQDGPPEAADNQPDRDASRPASSHGGRKQRDRDIPVLTASYLVPAQPVHRKVDRVARFRELKEGWSQSTFLRSGGDSIVSRRKSENFAGQFAELHAQEQERRRALSEDRVQRQAMLGITGNPYIIPSSKRRDALRWETRLRMQLRD
ncbi:hypothetical protein WJX84_001469 [Apatococcus fuscideae]|uniref:Centriolar and ciliogenesis-associated protein HYLS1 C-terminal domain-containing protein n=1 Tax=Apatococcus fuscideae TaxID=2026836 RepID=A0AAW1TD79_9CHLO